MEHALWTEDYVVADLDFEFFRADNAYVWQERDGNSAVSLLLTAYYQIASGREWLLRSLAEDGAFGVQTVSMDDAYLLSRDLLDSVSEIAFLDDVLGIRRWAEVSVLDIGAGYGRLAHRMAEALPEGARIACVDSVAESTFLSEFYLSYRDVLDRCKVVELPDIDDWLAENEVDIVVNVHSFSECSRAVVAAWLDTVAESKARYLMVVPNRGTHEGSKLTAREADGSTSEYQVEIEDRGFELIACRRKYSDPSVQCYGVSPTYHWLFART